MMFSIIIPVYNTEAYIDRCIQSILMQEFKDYELIIVDDHSTDGSLAVCKKYSNGHDCIRVMENPRKGVSSARNTGIRAAAGEYIMFVDSDDALTEGALDIFAAKVRSAGEKDLFISSYEIVSVNGVTSSQNIPDFDGSVESFLANVDVYMFGSPWCKLFKRFLLLEHHILFPEDMDFAEDICFVCRYLEYADTIVSFHKSTYHYYVREESLSHGYRAGKYHSLLVSVEAIKCLLTHRLGSTGDKLIFQKIRIGFLNTLYECALSKDKKYALQEIMDALGYPQTAEAFKGRDLTFKHRVLAFFVRHKLPLCLLFIESVWLRLHPSEQNADNRISQVEKKEDL